MRRFLDYTGGLFNKEVVYYKQAFDELEKMKDLNFSKFKYLLNEKYKIPIPRFLFPKISFAGKKATYFHRIRRLSEIEQDLNLISTYSHPPIKYASTGRANLAGSPVLYLSLLPQTPCKELQVEGEEVAISEWAPHADETFGVYLFLPFGKTDNSPLNILGDSLMNKIKEHLKSMNQHEREAVEYITSRITNWFLEDKTHDLSSLISHLLLYDSDLTDNGIEADCIIYQSFKDREALNVAFHPRAMPKLQMNRVQIGSVGEVKNDGIVFNVSQCGINNGLGRIKWLI